MRRTFIAATGAAVCGLFYALYWLSGREPHWYRMYPESFNR